LAGQSEAARFAHRAHSSIELAFVAAAAHYQAERGPEKNSMQQWPDSAMITVYEKRWRK
jgi:hypothetical protein